LLNKAYLKLDCFGFVLVHQIQQNSGDHMVLSVAD